MKYRAHVAAVGLLMAGFLSASAMGQQGGLSAADVAKIKAETTAAMTAYVKLYSARDAKTIAQKFVTNPVMLVDTDGMTWATPDQAFTIFDGKFKDLNKTQYDHSEPLPLTVCVLTASNAIVSGKFRRINHDGSLLVEASAAYLFTKMADGWRISGQLGSQKNKVVTCD